MFLPTVPAFLERAYGANFERLTHIKRLYDPSNLFRMNQNVKP